MLNALNHPSFSVPPVDSDAPPGTVGWLRASVARFSSGTSHERRRELVAAELSRLDPSALYRAAHTLSRAGAALDEVTRVVPITVLASALGVTADVVAEVEAVARVYQPHLGEDPAADRAVATLVDVFGGRPDEPTAARIGLLVQAYAATGELIRIAVREGVSVPDALSVRPPVPATRRVALSPVRLGEATVAAGTVISVDLTDEPFGSGPHRCPGREHALAIAAGVVDGLLAGPGSPTP